MHHSGAHCKSDHVPTGIADHFGPEYAPKVVALPGTGLTGNERWKALMIAEDYEALRRLCEGQVARLEADLAKAPGRGADAGRVSKDSEWVGDFGHLAEIAHPRRPKSSEGGAAPQRAA